MNKRTAFLAVTLFIASCFGALAQQVLYQTDFSGQDFTRPANWAVFNAPSQDFWYLDNGQFATGNGDEILEGYSFAVVQVPGSENWRNYTVRCTAWMTQRNGKTILLGRWKDVNNHYEGYLECYEGNRAIGIEKVKDGRRTVLKVVSERGGEIKIAPLERGSSPADARPFAMTFFDDQISFTYDGKTYLLVKDNDLKTGTAGVGHWFNFDLFDNFVVEEATSPVPTAPAGAAAPPAPRVPTETRAAAPSLGQPSTYRILVASGVNQTQASDLRKRLEGWGYVPVEIAPKDGNFEVYLGAFTDEAKARDAKRYLEREGLAPGPILGVVSLAPSVSVTPVPTPAPGVAEEKGFRVLVNTFPTQEEATKLKDSLENDGYVAVDVVPEGGQYAVYVGTFRLQEEASKFCGILQQDGYAFARVMETAKEPVAVAVVRAPSMRTVPATPTPVIPTEIKEKPEWKALTPEQRQEVENALRQGYMVSAGNAYVEELKNLKEMIDQLNKNQKEIFVTIRRQEEDRRQKELAVARLFDQVADAMDSRNWDKAQEYLNEIKKIDPNNPKIEWKQQVVSSLREGSPVEPKEFFAVTRQQDVDTAKKSARESESRGDLEGAITQWQLVKNLADVKSLAYKEASENIGRLQGIRDTRQRAEEMRRQRQELATYVIGGAVLLVLMIVIVMFARARKRDRELLKQVREIALKPLLELEEGKLPRELTESAGIGKEEEIEEIIPTEKKKAKPAPPPRKKIKLPRRRKEEVAAEAESSLYGGDLIITPEKSEEEEIAVTEEDVSDTTKRPAEAPAPRAPVEEPRESRRPERVETPAFSAESLFTGDHTPIDTSHIEAAANGPTREMFGDHTTTKPGSQEIDLEGLETAETGVEEETPEVIVPEEISLDDLLGESDKLSATRESEARALEPTVAPKTPPLGEAPSLIPAELPAAELVEKTKRSEPEVQKPVPTPAQEQPQIPEEVPKPEIAAALKAEPVAVPAESPAEVRSTDNVVYEQSFDDETEGTPPRNWSGKYDYANLMVTSEVVASRSSRSMKFEKKSGSGSAYYSCHFPSVSGRVGVEFDMRCDDKNKYLLGFYIEKDEDFRQSIHTIIHRTDSKAIPTLRVQGEQIPYSLGSWRHVRYEIDLQEGRVNGYVDGNLIADNVKLASSPSSINTLSIRDNLATTGVLYLDNIVIYKIK
jgi:hypothetical protein